MTCSLPTDLPWSALLEARALFAADARSVAFVQRDRWTSVDGAGPIPSDARAVMLVEVEPGTATPAARARATTVFTTDDRGLPDLRQRNGVALEPAMATAARVYLPVLLGATRARRAGRSFVAGHVTQTLDGRIACENGQSQWIGNDADQRHAHRMRALLDGVMIGATTALRDDPQLTVRHVEGANPRRIVVSGRARALRDGAQLGLMQGDGCEVLVDERLELPAVDAAVQVHKVPAEDGRLAPEDVLAALRRRGVHAIYLEGGSGLLSSFLHARSVDLLQVHIASMVLGSGLPSVQLPAVEHVDDGLHLHMDHAVLDGHVLLTCRPGP
ncbi:MAG: RibD family protein [Planctomycetes bacterium]|nr:RibD family protein [Planctomycetota bacterium]